MVMAKRKPSSSKPYTGERGSAGSVLRKCLKPDGWTNPARNACLRVTSHEEPVTLTKVNDRKC